MPFKSKSQQRWMFATHPQMARRWAAHTSDIKSLPEHVDDPEPEKKGSLRMSALTAFAKQAADAAYAEKLAADSKITPELVNHLAATTKLSVRQFCKYAYDDPAGYTVFLKLAASLMNPPAKGEKRAVGPVTPGQVLQGAANNPLIQRLLAAFKAGPAKGATGQWMQRNNVPLSGTQAGRIGVPAAAAGAGGAAGYGAMKPSAPKPQPTGQDTGGANMGPQPPKPEAAAPKPEAAPPAPKPEQGGPAAPKGMSTAGKAFLATGAAGLGALGAGALMRKKKKPAEKVVTAADAVKEAMRAVATKVAAAKYRRECAATLCGYLDTVIPHMAVEKTAAVRTLQAKVAADVNLADALRAAYPQLSGEERGVLGFQLVTKAAAWKQARGREEAVVKAKDGPAKMKQMCS